MYNIIDLFNVINLIKKSRNIFIMLTEAAIISGVTVLPEPLSVAERAVVIMLKNIPMQAILIYEEPINATLSSAPIVLRRGRAKTCESRR